MNSQSRYPMLRGVSLGSFQGFSLHEDIPIGPLTLIFGPNSSGKSSIFRSIKFLAQNIDARNREIVFTGPHVNLTDYPNTIHRKIDGDHFDVGLTLQSASVSNFLEQTPGRLQSLKVRVNEFHEVIRITLEGEDTTSEESSFILELDEVIDDEEPWFGGVWGPTRRNRPHLFGPFESILRTAGLHVPANVDVYTWPHAEFAFHDSNVTPELLLAFLAGELSRFLDSRGLIPRVYMAHSDPFFDGYRALEPSEEILVRQWITSVNGFLDSIDETFHSFFSRLCFVPSIRPLPNEISFEESWRSRFGEFGYEEGYKDVPDGLRQRSAFEGGKEISAALKSLTDGRFSYWVDELHSTSEDAAIGEQRGIYDELRRVRLGFKDVGVGISQVLPVLEALCGGKAGTVFIEQPELHLHPKAQAAMGEFIAINSAAKDLGKPQVIAETHSENLILRVQRLIRSGDLDHENVTVLYVDTDSETGSTRARHFPLNNRGEFIDEFPSDFVETRLDEIL